VEGSKGSDKKHDELVNPSYIILDNRLNFLEFLSTNVPLAPHQINIGYEVTLISNTPHVSEVYTTPITTFEDTPNQQKTTMSISLQMLNQVELVEVIIVEHVEKIIDQLVIEG
jgi:hypothetical protein